MSHGVSRSYYQSTESNQSYSLNTESQELGCRKSKFEWMEESGLSRWTQSECECMEERKCQVYQVVGRVSVLYCMEGWMDGWMGDVTVHQ